MQCLGGPPALLLLVRLKRRALTAFATPGTSRAVAKTAFLPLGKAKVSTIQFLLYISAYKVQYNSTSLVGGQKIILKSRASIRDANRRLSTRYKIYLVLQCTAVCTQCTKFTFRHPCTSMYVYTQYKYCVHTHCAVDLCVHTAVCNYIVISETGAGVLFYGLIFIVSYKHLQKFCKQRGSKNKFDLYLNKQG